MTGFYCVLDKYWGNTIRWVIAFTSKLFFRVQNLQFKRWVCFIIHVYTKVGQVIPKVPYIVQMPVITFDVNRDLVLEWSGPCSTTSGGKINKTGNVLKNDIRFLVRMGSRVLDTVSKNINQYLFATFDLSACPFFKKFSKKSFFSLLEIPKSNKGVVGVHCFGQSPQKLA